MRHLQAAWRRVGWTDAEMVHGHPLPMGGQFGHGQDHLDPDIFDAHERMHPWIRATLIKLLDADWGRHWADWRDWTRIYLAGSLASYWWGTPDFDVLVGVDVEGFRKHTQEFTGTEAELCSLLTQGFYTGLDKQVGRFTFPPAPDLRHICRGLGTSAEEVYRLVPEGTKPLGPLEMTWYANPESYDIRRIRPYAAYDVTRDLWVVHPVHPSSHYGPHSFGWNFWSHMGDLADRIHDVLSTDDATERRENAQALYDKIHSERNAAFGPGGGGQWDPRGLQWTVMSRWGLLGALEAEIHPERPVGHPAPLRA